jgi:hypothetical protein
MPTELDNECNTLEYYGVTNESTLHVRHIASAR